MEKLPDSFFADQIDYMRAGKSLRRAQLLAGEVTRDLRERRAAAHTMSGDPECYPGFSATAVQDNLNDVARQKVLWDETVVLRHEALVEPDRRSSAHYMANQAVYHQLALEMNAHYDRALAP